MKGNVDENECRTFHTQPNFYDNLLLASKPSGEQTVDYRWYFQEFTQFPLMRWLANEEEQTSGS